MYPFIQALHVGNFNLILGSFIVLLGALLLLRRKPEFMQSKGQRYFALAYMILVDIQLILGIALYFTSPTVATALSDFGAAMGASRLRFFALEHPLTGLLTLSFAHLLYGTAKRNPENHKRILTFAVLSGVMLVLTARSLLSA